MDLDKYTNHLYDKIITEIKKARTEQNFTQKQVAEALGIHPVTYADMESGKTKFSVVRLLATLKLLKIENIISLLEEEKEKPSSSDLTIRDEITGLSTMFNQQAMDIQEIKLLLQQLLQRFEKGN